MLSVILIIIREKYFPDLSYSGIIVEVGAATPEFGSWK